MRIGFDAYTIEHRNFTIEETLDFATEHDLEGVQFLEPGVISADLDPLRLRDVRQTAEAKGLALEIGLNSPNPTRPGRGGQRPSSVDERAAVLVTQIRAVAELGCRHARVYLGDRHDRFRRDVSWNVQLDATWEVIEKLKSSLDDLGVALAIETHADATSCEIRRFLEGFDPRIVGVMLDTGNLPMRLEDPFAVVESLAARVLGVHAKDAVLAFTPKGLNWQARPVGSGILPIPDLLSIVHRANPNLMLSIELHPRTYDLPIYNSDWLSYFPDLRPDSLAAVVRLAGLCERRFAEGSLARPEQVESIPWADRDLDWLASSVGYLRALVPMLGRVEDAITS